MSGYIMDLRKIVGHRPLLQVGASVIVEDTLGRILLQLRSDNHCWGYAGGSVELDFSSGPAAASPVTTGNNAALAHAALQELGYSPAESNAALKGVDPNATTEEMVRHALRAMVMKG